MPDYKEMYLTLFRAYTRVIEELKNAQLVCESLYIEGGEDDCDDEA